VDIAGWLSRMTDADKVALIDRLDTQALLGDDVFVVQVSGGWAKVTIPGQPSPLDRRGYPVWIPVRQLSGSPPPTSSRTVRVVAPHAYLRSAHDTVQVSFGTALPLLGAIGAVDLVGVPGGSTMTIDALWVTENHLPATGASVVATARQFVGLPYLWGGTSGYGFDCSGLVHLVFMAHGIVLPRDSDPQSRFGVPVARSNLQPGDLVFFSSRGVAYHVAIYAGAGMVIDSPSPGYAVRTIALTSMPNVGDYSGARRVLQ
jgi:gamma-D-glutamyl-L-lysine dipeptidyl-peptidase